MKKMLCFSFIVVGLALSGVVIPRAFAVSAEDKMELAITDNNPFNPSRGQTTTFRFFAKESDLILRVRIFTAAGILVREFPEQNAVKNVPYLIPWDGKNQDGETVARGIYLVNLQESENFTRGIVRKVAVIK